MTSAYLPSILTPIIGILFPGITMALLFIYIEQDSIS
uniref:Photosystem I reaction center subunit VIII n=1 Tax=Vertebrata lanosa TaxID=1261582 RepID=A0A0B5W3N4_9FLOR|nr:photosystem I reaction center subunit VIII [Vertebrata lanosa]AJH66020.1 photosystem I reaction center subunit VIII [Vertebrata lanosa]